MHHGSRGVEVLVERAQSAEWSLLPALPQERLRLRCAPALSRGVGPGHGTRRCARLALPVCGPG
ncbi:hypothetical protein CBM2599_A70152 [Cupriavidus taiwanensis]|uniref:Uncharacterized protein n=1 Tax=Cupriavidus taiwanensis TaxID=164546 RepID=A0A375D1Q0_9BURK|nr:hypothetical protein CBM2599_A70152 [Cupriavidus taiwanensis]SOY91667.1 hypothetical protein CBM2600_A80153 [Cupriavidus taiwanensis]SPD64210.1 protein of unknown function [Cupriavidus taiwanensis]